MIITQAERIRRVLNLDLGSIVDVKTNWLLNNQEVDIPDWDTYFMGITILTSMRSKDVHTKHGCVLVDSNKHIVGTGFNSYAKGLEDNRLPNTRPLKNKIRSLLQHAESNAIKNATIHNLSCCIAYVTGFPCISCLTELYQKDIRALVVLPNTCTDFNNYSDDEKVLYYEIACRMTIREFEDKNAVQSLLSSASQSKHLMDDNYQQKV